MEILERQSDGQYRHYVGNLATLQVQAYTPEDATNISQAVLDLSEKLLNNISNRSRSDAVQRAEAEVQLAARKLAEARQRLLEFRNANVLIDPLTKAKSIGEMIGQLTIDRLEIDNNLRSLSGVLAADLPSQRLQRTRLAAIDEQIASLKQKLTDAKSKDTVSAQLAKLKNWSWTRNLMRKCTRSRRHPTEKARQERDRQLLYLVVAVHPTTPEFSDVSSSGPDERSVLYDVDDFMGYRRAFGRGYQRSIDLKLAGFNRFHGCVHLPALGASLARNSLGASRVPDDIIRSPIAPHNRRYRSAFEHTDWPSPCCRRMGQTAQKWEHVGASAEATLTRRRAVLPGMRPRETDQGS